MYFLAILSLTSLFGPSNSADQSPSSIELPLEGNVPGVPLAISARVDGKAREFAIMLELPGKSFIFNDADSGTAATANFGNGFQISLSVIKPTETTQWLHNHGVQGVLTRDAFINGGIGFDFPNLKVRLWNTATSHDVADWAKGKEVTQAPTEPFTIDNSLFGISLTRKLAGAQYSLALSTQGLVPLAIDKARLNVQGKEISSLHMPPSVLALSDGPYGPEWDWVMALNRNALWPALVDGIIGVSCFHGRRMAISFTDRRIYLSPSTGTQRAIDWINALLPTCLAPRGDKFVMDPDNSFFQTEDIDTIKPLIGHFMDSIDKIPISELVNWLGKSDAESQARLVDFASQVSGGNYTIEYKEGDKSIVATFN